MSSPAEDRSVVPDLQRRQRVLEVRDVTAVKGLGEAQRERGALAALLDQVDRDIAYQERLQEQSHQRFEEMSRGEAPYQPDVADRLHDAFEAITASLSRLWAERDRLDRELHQVKARQEQLLRQRKVLSERLSDNRRAQLRASDRKALSDALEVSLLGGVKND